LFVATAARLVTICGADVAEQPADVTVTVNEPAAATVIDWVVAPVDQRFPVVEEDVSVMFPPGQIVVGPVMVGVTAPVAAATLNAAEVAEQPAAFVTVTVYVPAVDTTIDCVVAPVDQRFPVVEDDVNVIEPPAQESEAGPVIVGTGGADAPATTKPADVAEQPLALVTVTV
jgi:hypothetical protein